MASMVDGGLGAALAAPGGAASTAALVVRYVVTSLAIASVAASLATIVTFATFRSLVTFPVRLVCYLCVAIALSQAAFVANAELANSALCVPLAVVTHVAFLALFGWCFAIAFNFYRMIIKRAPQPQRLERYYHAACWGVPLLVAAIVGGTDFYGPLPAHCSPAANNCAFCYIVDDTITMMAIFVPALLVVVVNAVIFVFVACEIHAALTAAGGGRERRAKRRQYRVYVALMVSTGSVWLFGFVVALLPPARADGPDANAALYWASFVCATLFNLSVPAQGLLVFYCYCVRSDVRAKWAHLLALCCRCCAAYAGSGNNDNDDDDDDDAYDDDDDDHDGDGGGSGGDGDEHDGAEPRATAMRGASRFRTPAASAHYGS